MHLRFYLDENGEKVYTTKKEVNGLATQSAYPAPFSPDDRYSRERITLKERFKLLPIQQPCPILCMGPVSSIDRTNIKTSAARVTDHSSYPDGTIIKPQTDRRDYKFIRLSNGLGALLVHDPWIYLDPCKDVVGDSVPRKSAAAMAVNLGSLADPKDAHGLTHLLEHMLFSGSTKFQSENKFDSYLSDHGGASNAFTNFEYSCYHFNVEGKALFDALQRFAEMFISPLLNPDDMRLEIRSIDSEFTNQLQNDFARLIRLQIHTSTPGHPLNKFYWGNEESLKNVMKDINTARRCLKKLHDDYFCGESMHLVVIGGESLSILEKWARELFTPIKKNSPARLQTNSDGRIWTAGKFYKSDAIGDVHILEISWELPSLMKNYLTKAEEYLSYLLGHEGKGRIFNLLKAKGWATSLFVGVDQGWMFRLSFAYIFRVVIHLTDKGINEIFDIISYIYQFLKLMNEHPLQKWIFDELQKNGKVGFLMAEEKPENSYAAYLAENLRVYPPHHVLYAEYAYDEWDEKMVRDIMGFLTPGNMRVDLQTKDFEKHHSVFDIEPWFNIKYVVEDIPNNKLESWASSHTIDPFFHMPSKNPFISRNVSIRPTPPYSRWEHENPVMTMWCESDNIEKLPLVRTLFSITLNGANTNDKNVLMTRMFVLLLNDELSEIIFMAKEAKLETSIVYSSGKLVVKLNGLIESIPAYLSEVIKVLKSYSIEDSHFSVMKEEMRRHLSNAHTTPLDYSNYNLKRILFRGFRSAEAQLDELEKLSHVDLANFIPDLISKVHIEGYCSGNLKKAEARKIFDLFLQNFSKPLKPMDSTVSVMSLPASVDLVKDVRPKNNLDTNSSVQFYFQIGRNSTEVYTLAKLFEVLVKEQFFEEMRTSEQLGYLVSCGVRLNHGILGFYFYVQSSKFTPDYVQEKMIKFLKGIREMLRGLNNSEFENQKAGSFGLLLQIENQKCFCETSEVGNSDNGLLCGASQEILENELRMKTKKDLILWHDKYIMKSSTSRRLLVIRVWGADAEMKNSKIKASSMQSIGDIDAFKRESTFYEKKLEYKISSL